MYAQVYKVYIHKKMAHGEGADTLKDTAVGKTDILPEGRGAGATLLLLPLVMLMLSSAAATSAAAYGAVWTYQSPLSAIRMSPLALAAFLAKSNRAAGAKRGGKDLGQTGVASWEAFLLSMSCCLAASKRLFMICKMSFSV